jgi:RNA polymerase sigma-70 factor (ECF subfamily)
VVEFEDWYRRVAPRLVATLRVTCRDAGLAEDIASEALTRALERWPRVEAMENPEGWLHRVAWNLVRRHARRRGLERRLTDTRAAPIAVPDGVDVDVWSAVAQLPLRQREAIALRYLLDCTQGEIAQRMGVRPGTVAATLSAARRTLAGVLGDLEIADGTELSSG